MGGGDGEFDFDLTGELSWRRLLCVSKRGSSRRVGSGGKLKFNESRNGMPPPLLGRRIRTGSGEWMATRSECKSMLVGQKCRKEYV